MPVASETTLPNSIDELRVLASALIERLGQHTEQVDHQAAKIKEQSALIEKLKFELARLRRWRFGQSSESVDNEQLALWSAELDGDIASAERKLAELTVARNAPAERAPPKRERLPEHLPRLEERHELACTDCPACGHALESIGEEISEQLDIVPAKFFVRRHIRPKYCCRACQSIHTAGLPAQPIDKAIAAPGLLAHVLVSKFADHLPFYRQEEIYAREGVEIPRATQAGWVGQLQVLAEPLVERLAEQVMAEPLIQADETPVPVLAPGTGKTATGYLWAFRTGPFSDRQAVVFRFSAHRNQQVPKQVLSSFSGILQVDGYAGYNEVLRRAEVTEAGCFAHARRKYFELWHATKSPAAQTALAQIAKLYEIERDCREASNEARVEQRRTRAGPILAEFKAWLESTYAKSPPRGALAKAIQYNLNRWKALARYLEDGRINIDTNPVENCIRGIAVGKKNWLFCGSEGGGHRAALFYSLIESCKLNRVEPYAYFVHILARLPTARARDLDSLLPWNLRS